MFPPKAYMMILIRFDSGISAVYSNSEESPNIFVFSLIRGLDKLAILQWTIKQRLLDNTVYISSAALSPLKHMLLVCWWFLKDWTGVQWYVKPCGQHIEADFSQCRKLAMTWLSSPRVVQLFFPDGQILYSFNNSFGSIKNITAVFQDQRVYLKHYDKS